MRWQLHYNIIIDNSYGIFHSYINKKKKKESKLPITRTFDHVHFSFNCITTHTSRRQCTLSSWETFGDTWICWSICLDNEVDHIARFYNFPYYTFGHIWDLIAPSSLLEMKWKMIREMLNCAIGMVPEAHHVSSLILQREFRIALQCTMSWRSISTVVKFLHLHRHCVHVRQTFTGAGEIKVAIHLWF